MTEIRKNYGNNGIYGRFPNSAEAFGFLATLHSHFASLRSGHITCGYEAPGVAPLTAQIAFGNFFYPQTVVRNKLA